MYCVCVHACMHCKCHTCKSDNFYNLVFYLKNCKFPHSFNFIAMFMDGCVIDVCITVCYTKYIVFTCSIVKSVHVILYLIELPVCVLYMYVHVLYAINCLQWIKLYALVLVVSECVLVLW